MQNILKLIVIQERHHSDKDGMDVVVASTLCGTRVCHLGADELCDNRIGTIVEVVRENNSWKLLTETPPNDVSMMLANFLLQAQTKVLS